MAYNAPLPEAAVLASTPLIRQLLRGHVLPNLVDLENDVRHSPGLGLGLGLGLRLCS